MNRTIPCAVLLLVGSACASVPPPTEKMTTAEAAIRGASELGAPKVPRAGLHLQLAQEQVDKAKRLMQDGYHAKAGLALQRAQADAELAIAISKENTAIEEAKEAQATVQKLRARPQ